MGRIIKLRGDQHHEAQSLLPWYVTGRLDPAEQAELEAHLSGCPECQAELKSERRLKAEIVALPLDVEQGWARLQRRMRLDPPNPAGRLTPRAWLAWIGREAGRRWSAGGPWLGWALAAPLVMLLFMDVRTPPPSAQPARYHALGASAAAAAANVVVIFRPQTSEQAFRQTLRANNARLVDGPTEADAYLLHVPATERGAALTRLRGSPEIVLAEPVDAGEPP